ncbi:hypothetical protein [Flavilitoribacter nigricans]|uniref:Uncharacterized protein n=1 Tax=Flavilitoribacter nigricans (strain ATCC 23147 / DSM 23189 / NBRC 102662 / NCIMB 1420 / SS-2) TaxID=1122177 RepID=A0A2D0NIB4_FLAN2|nr:hypothetical protein [Flavilitoribacter nigricans]PHN08178.1 hypothetical protein CRP01_02330 [Flavilitoribacter nigricans DSM 23189 = NBRC 102662]
MEKSLGLATLLFFLLLGIVSVEDRNPPLFCTLDQAWEAAETEQLIGRFSNKDTLLEHDLYLLSDSAGQPQLFYADVLTPVCIDGVCKPVFIELYWDLTGGYAGYGVYEDKPLTKFDHDEFLPQDHKKLDQLLADNNSVLRRKELSDLFDEQATALKKIEFQGEELDAVSGATKKEIKESIVEGALYSCYTLWHLIHGEAARDIEDYLDSIYTEALEERFLFSDYGPYNYYALKAMEAGSFSQYGDRIATIFGTTKPLIRTYILKKMPADLLRPEDLSRQFYQHFAAVDINTKTLLINHLPQAHSSALTLLSTQLEIMTKNQLKTYLEVLAANGSMSAEIRKNLEASAGSQEYAYGYLIGQWLSGR